MPAIWSVAIFAHNEAATLADAVRSAQIAGEGASTEIVILANGCRDNTVQIARDLALVYRNIHVIEIALADKANAWNHYVHEISAQLPFCDALMHVFMDGDVHVSAPSFGAFATAFDLYTSANAVGALPIAGRDQAAWRQRMTANGTLARGLYALRGAFLQRIRQLGIHIPHGFIGEDWLVSLFAKTDLGPLSQSAQSVPKIVFARDAGFGFRSLSSLRPTD